jgi:hypothetical protein
VERNTEFVFHELYAKEKSYEEYRSTGVHRFSFEVPEYTEELHLAAYYNDAKNSRDTYTETTAYAGYGPSDRHIQVRDEIKLYLHEKRKRTGKLFMFNSPNFVVQN